MGDDGADDRVVSRGVGGWEESGRVGLIKRTDYREELDLSGRSLSYTAGLASTYVALTSLNISNNAVTRLDSLPTMLVHLNASHNLLRHISGLEHNYELQTLNLAHNSIVRLSGLEQCSALVEISLQSNEIKVVSDLECNLNLERVDLSHNSIPTVEALRTLSLNSKVTWLCLKGNPCAHNGYRHRLTGLLPGLVMLDDMRMPKNGYRPSSPGIRQLQTADGAGPPGSVRRNASPAAGLSGGSKGPVRAFHDGASSQSTSYDRGGRRDSAGDVGGALEPWNSSPKSASVRTFGSVTARAIASSVGEHLVSVAN